MNRPCTCTVRETKIFSQSHNHNIALNLLNEHSCKLLLGTLRDAFVHQTYGAIQ
jgi:hypothetical protein